MVSTICPFATAVRDSAIRVFARALGVGAIVPTRCPLGRSRPTSSPRSGPSAVRSRRSSCPTTSWCARARAPVGLDEHGLVDPNAPKPEVGAAASAAAAPGSEHREFLRRHGIRSAEDYDDGAELRERFGRSRCNGRYVTSVMPAFHWTAAIETSQPLTPHAEGGKDGAKRGVLSAKNAHEHDGHTKRRRSRARVEADGRALPPFERDTVHPS